MQNRSNNINIIGVFSALLILSVHSFQYAGIDYSVGSKGVLLFFILSGFLESHSFIQLSMHKFMLKPFGKMTFDIHIK